jgi:hypothetical protein
MITIKHYLFISVFVFTQTLSLSQTSKDGAETVSSSGIIFNRYDKLVSTALAGDFSISLNNIANLEGSAISGASNNPYAANAVGVGDLLMIIKMQGAAINTTNSSSYGNITAYNNTGVYELVAVQSISGNTIILSAALANSFVVSTSQRVQVVRIPRLSSLTINAGASLTGQAWGSSYTGGVVAIEVTGNAVVNGTINANSIGYRGGAIDNSTSTLQFPISDYVGTTGDLGAEKGESIAGYQADYDLAGRYCKGAPANGGGGGNAHNGGGGGGANGGNPATWDGKGNPDISVNNWILAWNLEGGTFSTHTSSGGGRGGYTFSARNGSATVDPPGDRTWGGDDRQNSGGLGGRPLTYASNTLFMGGGGGAGDQNQGFGTAGGNGGGIIYLTITGTLSGAGSINANGATGADVIGTSAAANGIDAAGGGGAGGAIKLNVLGAISGVGLNANGGNGGSQRQINVVVEAEGPGGGGGGGYIAVTGLPSITMSTAGGVNGTTNSSGLAEFLPNGATMAASGSTTTNISYQSPPPQVFLPLTFTSFGLQPTGNQLIVNWTFARETNVLRYDLEQSTGNGLWTVIASEWASNESETARQYSIRISIPVHTVHFRIKMIDKKGAFQYSAIKVFSVGSNKFSIRENGESIQIFQLAHTLEVKLFNNNGQEIKFAIEKALGVARIDKNKLTKGVYYVMISSVDAKSVDEKEIYRFVR